MIYSTEPDGILRRKWQNYARMCSTMQSYAKTLDSLNRGTNHKHICNIVNETERLFFENIMRCGKNTNYKHMAFCKRYNSFVAWSGHLLTMIIKQTSQRLIAEHTAFQIKIRCRHMRWARMASLVPCMLPINVAKKWQKTVQLAVCAADGMQKRSWGRWGVLEIFQCFLSCSRSFENTYNHMCSSNRCLFIPFLFHLGVKQTEQSSTLSFVHRKRFMTWYLLEVGYWMIHFTIEAMLSLLMAFLELIYSSQTEK